MYAFSVHCVGLEERLFYVFPFAFLYFYFPVIVDSSEPSRIFFRAIIINITWGSDNFLTGQSSIHNLVDQPQLGFFVVSIASSLKEMRLMSISFGEVRGNSEALKGYSYN